MRSCCARVHTGGKCKPKAPPVGAVGSTSNNVRGGRQSTMADFREFEGIALESCHRALASWIAVNKRPFNVAQDELFGYFCNTISSGRYSPCAYETLMKHLEGLDRNAQALLAKALQDAIPGTLTITVDAWTSG